MKSKKNIQKILFTILVIGCVAASFIFFIRDNNRRATELSVGSLQDATEQSAARIADDINRSQMDLRLTAYLYEEMLQEPVVTQEDLKTLVEESPFDYVEFISPDGIDIDLDGNTLDLSDRDYFKEGMKGNSGLEAIVEPITGEENLIVFYTPLHYDGQIIGVLIGKYMESQVQSILHNSFFGENSRTYLCTRAGDVIASGNGDLSGANILQTGITDDIDDPQVKEELKDALAGATSYQFQYNGTAGTGNAYVMPLDGTDWVMIQTFPSQVTTNMIWQANRAGLFLLGMLMAIFVVCTIVMQVASFLQKRHLVQENQEKTYVVDGITTLYKTFVLLDLEKDTYRYLAGSTPRRADLAPEGDVTAFMNVVASYVGDEEEKEKLREQLSKEMVQKHLGPDNPYLRYEFREPGEEEKWDSMTLIALHRKNGIATEILFTYQDVTKVKKREQKSYEALKDAYQAVESANQAKSNFLSNMSHDIRTPMNAIMGMTAIAAMNIDNPDRVKDCLNKITISSKHLLGLINEVLDMSKIESGKLVFAEEEFSLSDTIESMVTMFLPQTEARKQNFKVNIADVPHEEVIGDSMRLQQIFVNILGNSVKFTQEGGEINFSICEKPSGMYGCGCYVFTFEDNGMGMDEEFQKQVFEPFARAERTESAKLEGTGLGMAIVKNIVQMMNGDIQVESELGKGTKFTVTVYLKLNNSKHDDVEGLANLTVLVADDDQFAGESACLILNDIGMVADWVISGDEAIGKVIEYHEANKDYAAVILDWKMPGKDGIATAKEIRAKVGEDVPIIILSAFDYSSVEQEAREAGVNAFIAKPLFRSRLVYVMKSLMLGEKEKATDAEHLRDRDFSGKRVLLVEDNELNMEIAIELLSQTGVQIETAVDGRQALDLVTERPAEYYDLVLMDIQMPQLNGYETTEAIRGSGREDLQTLPIVAMTADAFMDDVRHAKQCGMNGHISKPIEIANLLQVLDTWIAE